MSFHVGKYKILKIKVSGVYYPIGCLLNNDFAEDAEMMDTTTRENVGWITAVPMTQSYSISFTGVTTLTNREGAVISYEDLKVYLRAGTLIDWIISRTEIEDDLQIDYGTGYITDLSEEAGMDEFITFSGTITGTGMPLASIDATLPATGTITNVV